MSFIKPARFSTLAITIFILHLVSGLNLPGINLSEFGSSICTKREFDAENGFSACLFVKLGLGQNEEEEEEARTVLSVADTSSNSTIILNSMKDVLLFRINESDIYLRRKCSIDKWCRVCMTLNAERKKLSFDINYIEQNFKIGESVVEDVGSDYENDPLKKKNEKNILVFRTNSDEENSNVTFCIGSTLSDGRSFIGEVAAVTFDSTKSLNFSNNRCFDNIGSEISESFEEWIGKGVVVAKDVDVNELCKDTLEVIVMDSFVSYSDHIEICKGIHGRLLTEGEFPMLQEDLVISSNALCNDENYGSAIKASWFDAHEEKNESLDEECPVFSYSGKTGTQSCIIESYCNSCIFPTQLEVLLYGPLKKFDRKYILRLDANERIKLEGSKKSFVEWVGVQKWALKSSLHSDQWLLYNQTIPLGRRVWQNLITREKITLAFTTCSESEFTCSEGSCLPFYSRCNGVVECKDETDEENCQRIEKKRGYAINQLPPPIRNGNITEIFFYSLLYNIADISSIDGKAVIDLVTVFAWRDPRLIIWNPKRNTDVDCNQIWTPDIGLADGYPNGFQVDFKIYRSSCTIRSTLVKSKSNLKKSTRDPYMGRFAEGEQEMIVRIFSGLATVFCRFNLRKYPFGKQMCPFAIWPDNALLEGGYKLLTYLPLQGNKTNVYYAGRKELGEYYFISSPYKLVGKNTTISVTIELETLSGFHILNSFTPSFLICLISYSTFFFPLRNFNERIMVSLTALLVMAALFTQTSETSVRTPYFKYLDIWYVVLIIFGFLVVVFNTIVHNFQSRRVGSVKPCEKTARQKTKADTCSKHSVNTNRLNVIFQFGFAIGLIIFITIYCLAASEAI